MLNIDFYIFQCVNNWAGRYLWLDGLAIFLAEYLGYLLMVSIFFFLLKNRKKYQPMVVQGFSAAIFSRFVITEIIRWLWPRPRPFVENHVNLLLETNQAAFPSGHAAFFFALSAVVYFYNKKAGSLFFAASVLICLARVFCGIHWPSDILAGAFLGVFCGWLFTKILKFKKQK